MLLMAWNLNYVTLWLQLNLSSWWQGRYFCLWQNEMLCDVKIAAASKKGQMIGYQRHTIHPAYKSHFLKSSRKNKNKL